MRIIISPAKKMNVDTESLPHTDLPQFLQSAERLKAALRAMPPDALQRLWQCNDSIAALNTSRLQSMDLQAGLTPAVLSYEGIQYQYMAPGVMEDAHLSYLQEHLRIVSGFYGLLRPFDGVTPYRLEMQARLAVDGCKDLYAFWGDKLAQQLSRETDFLLNLASREYSAAVLPHLPRSVRVLTCTFGELVGGRVVEKGTLCKMARGHMVRWLAEHRVTRAAELQAFADLWYTYAPEHSTPEHYVFLSHGKSVQTAGILSN